MQTEPTGTLVLERASTSLIPQEAGSNSDRDLNVTGVPADMIEGVWEEVGPWIEKALSFGNGEFGVTDIYDALIGRDMQLWIIYEMPEKAIVLAVVTQIIHYPLKKTCRVVTLGGESHLLWERRLFVLEEWASDQGCSNVEAFVRGGLAKKMKHLGYNNTYTVVSKDIKGGEVSGAN
jgi:hypothetical protein